MVKVKKINEKLNRKARKEDARFLGSFKDPRFRPITQKSKQVVIDERFEGIFTDPDFQISTKRDKYGRKVKAEKDVSMQKFYRLDKSIKNRSDNKIEKAEKGILTKTTKKEKPDKNETKEKDKKILEDKLAVEKVMRMRGIVEENKNSEESSISSSDSENYVSEEEIDEEEEKEKWGAGYWAANPHEPVEDCDSTRRVAVVDLDWSHVRASDILVLCRSVCPDVFAIKKVTIYYSDYGLATIPKEEALGLSAFGIFGNPKYQKSEEGEESEKEAEKSKGEEIDIEKLRRYELSKLRYFFAVVECENDKVAEHLVKSLDGAEYETSQCILDLRFVPDEECFDKRPILESCTEPPPDFEGAKFEYQALQKVNVQCTWDQEDTRKQRVVKRTFTEDELKMQDFSAYLASESEISVDAEKDEEAVRALKLKSKYEKLLNDEEDEKGNNFIKTKNWSTLIEEDSNAPSDSEAGSKDEKVLGDSLFLPLKKEKDKMADIKDGQAIWKKYEEKKQENIRRRKIRGQFWESDMEASFSSDTPHPPLVSDKKAGGNSETDDFFEGLVTESEFELELESTKKEKEPERGDKREVKEERRKKKKELELLALDDAKLKDMRKGKVQNLNQEDGKNMKKKKLSRKEKIRQKIEKKKFKQYHESDDEDEISQKNFEIDLDDKRFRDLFESAEFAIDPTMPAFKKTRGARNIFTKIREKRKKEASSENSPKRTRE